MDTGEPMPRMTSQEVAKPKSQPYKESTESDAPKQSTEVKQVMSPEITSVDQVPENIRRQIEDPVFREGVEFAKEVVAKVTAEHQKKLENLERRLSDAQRQLSELQVKQADEQIVVVGSREGDIKIINCLTSSIITPDELEKLSAPSSKLVAYLIKGVRARLSRDNLAKLGDELRSIVGRELITPGETLNTGGFAGYKVIKYIASGAHGDVYLATDSDGIERVLKVGKKDLGETDDNVRERIWNEMEVIGYLSWLVRQNSPTLEDILPVDPMADIVSYSNPVMAEGIIEGRPITEVTMKPEFVLEMLYKITRLASLVKSDPQSKSYKSSYGSDWSIASLELDRRGDTIMIDPNTGKFRGLIDFSSTLCPFKDKAAALKKARENTATLGKLAHGAMTDFNNAPADIKNLIIRMEAGEFEDFASVFGECEKLKKYLPE